MGGVFGGGGGGGSTTTVTQSLSPEQQQLLGQATPIFSAFLQNPPQLFPGSSIAGFNPLQQAGQAGAVQAAAGPATELAQTGQGLQNFLSGPVLYPETNPALAAATQAAIRPIAQQFTQSVLPNIRSGFQNAGQYGSSRQGIAEGLASQGFLDAAGGAAANLQNQAYQGGLEALSRGLFALPQTQALQFAPSTATEAVGSQQQALQQAYLSEAANRYLQEQLIPFNLAQDVASIAVGLPGGSSQTNASQASPSTGQNVLGGAALGAGLGAFGGLPVLGAGLGAIAGLFF